MRTVNIHEAKTQLSKLIAKVEAGEPFVIARAGKPVARVSAIDNSEATPKRRIGFMEGQFKVPENIKDVGREEIEAMFGLND